MKNKKFDLREEYKQSWGYIKESKRFIYFAIFIFLIFLLIGFFVPAPKFLSRYIIEYLKILLEQTKGFSNFDWIRFIFLNNLQSSFFGMVFGMVFGIYSLFGAIANGYLLGFVGSISVAENGFSVLWKILPHGIFELPAIFLSLGLGLKLGSFIYQRKKKESFKNFFFNSLRVFFYIIIPLLIVAAIIEGTLVSLIG